MLKTGVKMITLNSGDTTNVVRSAVKVLETFRLMCRVDKPLLVSHIAAELNISASTAYRAAETLTALGFAHHASSGNGYVPSLDVVELAGNIMDHIGIKPIAREILVDVARTFGETITLGIRDLGGDSVIFIDRVEGSHELRFFCDVGRRLPLHVGAAPRCWMAHLSDQEFDHYLETAELEPFTPHTKTTLEALRRDRDEIRNQGYAISSGEVNAAVSAVGVPIYGWHDNIIAVLAIANLSSRWSRSDIRIRANAMRDAAGRIQRQYRPSRPSMRATA